MNKDGQLQPPPSKKGGRRGKKKSFTFGKFLGLVADLIGIFTFASVVRQHVDEITIVLGLPENIGFYFLFFYGSFAAILGGLLWNGLNSLNDRLPPRYKLMKRSPYVGGTSRSEPHGKETIIWSIVTNFPLVITLMVLNYLYHFMEVRTQALLYAAFIIGTAVGAKLFYDFSIAGNRGVRAYFEARKYSYLRRELWSVVIWSFTISALGFLFMGITRALIMPDLVNSNAIIATFFKQVVWATGLTTLAVIFCVLIFPKKPRYETARGIIAGWTLRLMLFFGLLIL